MELPCYKLPSHPEVRCQDRLSITDREEDEVPVWAVLTALLSNGVHNLSDLIDLLETIAVTLRGTSPSDYGCLREICEGKSWASFSRTWPVLATIALEMPQLFPENEIPVLSKISPRISLTRRQAACLIIHQFLCTLPPPEDRRDFYDFSIWYSSTQPHPSAAKVYLTSIFTYFNRLPDSILVFPDWRVEYSLVTATDGDARDTFESLEVVELDVPVTDPGHLGLPDGACVISANSMVGFGQSATQEEIQVGTSPEACPIVLFTPTLREDEVLVVRGAEAIINTKGDRRDLKCEETLNETHSIERRRLWQKRAMLFMDALELDVVDTDSGLLPDLLPGNVERELRKAHTAFGSGAYSHIFTGLWGCGAFGGDPDVKAVIQWCAASMAGAKLIFVCNTLAQRQFGIRFRSFVELIRSHSIPVSFVKSLLLELKPDEPVKHGTPVLTLLEEKLQLREGQAGSA